MRAVRAMRSDLLRWCTGLRRAVVLVSVDFFFFPEVPRVTVAFAEDDAGSFVPLLAV